MTYAEALNKQTLVGAIELMTNGKRLEKGTAATVMMLKVSLDKASIEFNDKMKEIVNGLKQEGFDERQRNFAKLQEINSKEDATEEEKKEAEELAKNLEGFEEELATLNEEAQEAHKKLMKEECNVKSATITKDDWANIYDVMGVEGNSKLSFYNEPLSNEQFLSILAASLVA